MGGLVRTQYVCIIHTCILPHISTQTHSLSLSHHSALDAYERAPRNRVLSGALISIYKYIIEYMYTYIHIHIHIHMHIYTCIHTYRSSAPGVRDGGGVSVIAKEEEWYNSWYEPDGDGTLADDTLAASMLLGSHYMSLYTLSICH